MSVTLEKSMEGYRLIYNQYLYIDHSVLKDGSIIDNQLSSPLNFQYHYAAYILSSTILGNDENIDSVCKYYLERDQRGMAPSNEFNVFLLLNAVLLDKKGILSKYKTDILNSIYHRTDQEFFNLNNNFRALRLVGLLLEAKLKKSTYSQNIENEINWILELQFDDGFFPDSNRNFDVVKNEGVPHLSYHAKITLCVGLSFLYSQDSRLKTSFFNALNVLLQISEKNNYFFYGRSTNALFGYASLYYVLMVAYSITKEQFYLNKAKSILSYLKKYQHNDFHLSINLNKNDLQRKGFDSYMYNIVYNAYSNAIFLLANQLNSTASRTHYSLNKKLGITVYRNSGFVAYRNKKIQYIFNYKGHQDSKKYKFDSRVSPLSLLYFYRDHDNLLPGVGYYPQGISSFVEKKFIIKKLYSKLYSKLYYDWLPLFSGNIFSYRRGNVKFYPYKCLRMIKLGNKIIIKFEARSRSLFQVNEKKDFFIISIKLEDEITYKLFFFKKINILNFTYREKPFGSALLYCFDKQIKYLKTLNIETSHGEGKLYRVLSRNLTNLTIRVSTKDDCK